MNQEHFKGKYEVELKYRLSSKVAFLKKLKSRPHQVMLENNVESDCYFDDLDNQLEQAGKSLCIREMQPSGIRLWIVKGPGDDRCEATQIDDALKAQRMLKNIGFIPTLSLTKCRSIYFIEAYHITVDVLDGIGEFAEFAIMTDDANRLESYRAELTQLAAGFGLSDVDLEPCAYKTLAAQKRLCQTND
ncbi:MAG: Adenylate cyclase CyaB [Candidatus Celerinatantimonas neptuna]|nr:MAG: Adenylate cyclase CyaB [Candidatus Celerinatantimonas neptuna]